MQNEFYKFLHYLMLSIRDWVLNPLRQSQKDRVHEEILLPSGKGSHVPLSITLLQSE